MLKLFSKKLSEDDISDIKKQVEQASGNDNYELVFESIKPLKRVMDKQKDAAICLIEIVEDSYLSIEDGREVLESVFEIYKDNLQIVSYIGNALESARNIDELNVQPPSESLFHDVIKTLEQAIEGSDLKTEELICDGLSTATRMMSRQYDLLSAQCHRRLVELDPSYPGYYYGLGLYCKTRGLFAEGMKANQKGLELLEKPRESYLWNLGICATGAGQGEVALNIWKSMGNKLEMGRFNLPDGRYPSCKVKLAKYPLAERNDTNDYPGEEETIWIERLSPCHGIIRSVLYQDLGIDYGDVILIDGAPITYHTYGDGQIPVFPHLATLIKSKYQFFDFAAVQEEKGQIANISASLEKDSVIYAHTESFRVLCSTCWQNPELNHSEHSEEQKSIVTGRIAAPKDISAIELLAQIDLALDELPNCKFYSPRLCEAAKQNERAVTEQNRFNLLVANT